MEGYVWELTHALVKLGLKVGVICEQVYGSPSPEIQIYKIEVEKSLRRWKAMMAFRNKANSLIKTQFVNRQIVVHSHERSLAHHITTFHGPPMEVKMNWWRLSALSPRIKAWIMMEKAEILGPQVQLVLPVSNLIKEKLISLYPELKPENLITAYPGVHESTHEQKKFIRTQRIGVHLVFVGKEWKRKGLEFAVRVAQNYSELFGYCTLDVYGPDPSEVPIYIRCIPNVTINGWSDEIAWTKFDALIHPAVREPFGMVVPEARSLGIPVLTTNLVGSTELNYDGVAVLEPTESPQTWAETLHELISYQSNNIPEIKWTWNNLALKHIDEIYPRIFIN